MKRHLKDSSLQSALIDRFIERGVKGGQHSNGSQKDGFLKYEKGKPAAIFDLKHGNYCEISKIKPTVDQRIGTLPADYCSWKNLLKDPKREKKLSTYFTALAALETTGAKMAINYLKKSKTIGAELVHSGVAHSEKDVNQVMMNGFYWLYGPINNYV